MLQTPLEIPIPRYEHFDVPPLRTPAAVWPSSLTSGIVITVAWLYGLGLILSAYEAPFESSLVVNLVPAPPSAPQQPAPPPKPKPKPRPAPKPVPTPIPKPVESLPAEPEPIPEHTQDPEPELTPPSATPPMTPPEPTTPPAPTVVRMFSLTQRPVLIYQPDLHSYYPKTSQKNGLEGFVEIEYLVGPAGTVDDIRIITSGGEAFDAAATAWARDMKFKPGYMGNQAVSVWIRQKFKFDLQ